MSERISRVQRECRQPGNRALLAHGLLSLRDQATKEPPMFQHVKDLQFNARDSGVHYFGRASHYRPPYPDTRPSAGMRSNRRLRRAG